MTRTMPALPAQPAPALDDADGAVAARAAAAERGFGSALDAPGNELLSARWRREGDAEDTDELGVEEEDEDAIEE
jgi:hypothetical protein